MDMARKLATANSILNRAMESLSNDFPDKFPAQIQIDSISWFGEAMQK